MGHISFFFDYINLLGKNMHIMKENTRGLLDTARGIAVEVRQRNKLFC
jgi:hypothetical protein